MSSLDPALLAQRLYDATEEERYELLLDASRDTARRETLRQAWLLLEVARATREKNTSPTPVGEETAMQLARGRVALGALCGWDDVEWLLQSLTAPEPVDERASPVTRRRALAHVRPPIRWWARRMVWVPALGLAAVTALVTVVMWLPATEPWAHSLELSRGDVWRLSATLEAEVVALLEHDTSPPALFEVPRGPSARERRASATGVELPHLLHPRWEAVAGARPTFRWSATDTEAGSEVILLDAARKLLWSAKIESGQTLAYPADRPPLEPGESYYWKVNRHAERRLVASAYTAFRVLDEGQRRQLDRDIDHLGNHPFVRGVAYDRHGLYFLASAAFEEAADADLLPEKALAARDRVLAKQGLLE